MATFLGSRLVTQCRSAAPKNCVIFLHGSGDSGDNIGRCVGSYLESLPDTVILYPTAPLRPYSLNGGSQSRVWHDRKDLSLSADEDAKGIEQMGRHFVTLLNDVNEKMNIPNNRIVVGGFSQGGHMALQLGFRDFLTEPVAGVFALSAFLAERSVVFEEMTRFREKRNIPVFMAHGDSDPLVEYSWGQRTFDRVVAEGDLRIASFHQFRGFHHIDEKVMENLETWIAQRFSSSLTETSLPGSQQV